jgi:hypothetical protein
MRAISHRSDLQPQSVGSVSRLPAFCSRGRANVASLASKVPSTYLASAAVRAFLARRLRCAQFAASTVEPSSSISASNLSRVPVIPLDQEWAQQRYLRRPLTRYRNAHCGKILALPVWPIPALPFGFSALHAGPGFIGVARSGASRSSSPAMPTRVKSVYRCA